MTTERAPVSGMSVSPKEGVCLPPPHIHRSAPAPQPVTAASVMNDSAVGPSKRTGGHETNHSCQALIFPWESHLHPPHPSLGTRLPLYPPTHIHPRQSLVLQMRVRGTERQAQCICWNTQAHMPPGSQYTKDHWCPNRGPISALSSGKTTQKKSL